MNVPLVLLGPDLYSFLFIELSAISHRTILHITPVPFPDLSGTGQSA